MAIFKPSPEMEALMKTAQEASQRYPSATAIDPKTNTVIARAATSSDLKTSMASSRPTVTSPWTTPPTDPLAALANSRFATPPDLPSQNMAQLTNFEKAQERSFTNSAKSVSPIRPSSEMASLVKTAEDASHRYPSAMADRAKPATQKEFEAIGKEFKQSWDTSTAKMKSLDAIEKDFSKTFKEINKELTPEFEAAKKALKEEGKAIKKEFDSMKTQLSPEVKKLQEDLKKQFAQAKKDLQPKFNALQKDLKATGKAFADAFKTSTEKTAKDLKPVADQIVSQVDTALTDVKKLIKERRKETHNAENLISGLKATGEFLKESFEEAILANTEASLPDEIISVGKEVTDLVTKMFYEVPESVRTLQNPAASLQSQMRVSAQQLLMDKNVAGNVASLMKMAANDMSSKLDGFFDSVNAVKDSALGSLESVMSALGNQEQLDSLMQNFSSILGEARGQLTAAKGMTAALQGKILAGQEFSEKRLESIVGSLKGLKNSIIGGSNPFKVFCQTDGEGLLSEMNGLTEDFSDITEQFENLKSLPENMIKTLSPGDLFQSNFTALYDKYNSALSAITSAQFNVGSDPRKAMCQMSNVLAQVDTIKGALKTLQNANFKQELTNLANPIIGGIKNFQQQLQSLTMPTAQMKELEYGVKSVFRSVENLIKGKTPGMEALKQIGSKIQDAADGIMSQLNTVKNVLNAFTPPITADMKAFAASVGEYAPHALNNLLSGAISKFSGALKDPMLMTAAGSAFKQLGDVASTLKATGVSLSMTFISQLHTVQTFLSGQHMRLMISSYTSNLAARKSEALKSLKKFDNAVLKGAERLVTSLQSSLNKLVKSKGAK